MASRIIGFLALLLPFVTASHWGRRHQEIAHRARGDVDIHKRQSFSNARFTFYDVGLGACGDYNVASDWIVALNVVQYGNGYPGPYCFQSITIQYGGKTAQAVIMDECMGCGYGELDFSRGLFDYFADESVGEIYGTWWFDNGSGGSGGGGGDQTTSSWTPPTTTWEQPTTTSTPEYTPPATTSTPAYTPPATTSSAPAYTPPPTTSTMSKTSSSTSLSSSTSFTSLNFNTGVSSGLAVPTGVATTPGTNNPQNIPVIDDILVEVGILLSVAVKI